MVDNPVPYRAAGQFTTALCAYTDITHHVLSRPHCRFTVGQSYHTTQNKVYFPAFGSWLCFVVICDRFEINISRFDMRPIRTISNYFIILPCCLCALLLIFGEVDIHRTNEWWNAIFCNLLPALICWWIARNDEKNGIWLILMGAVLMNSLKFACMSGTLLGDYLAYLDQDVSLHPHGFHLDCTDILCILLYLLPSIYMLALWWISSRTNIKIKLTKAQELFSILIFIRPFSIFLGVVSCFLRT